MRSPSSSLSIIVPRRARWILPDEVLGMVPGTTSSTRAGRCPRPSCTRWTMSRTRRDMASGGAAGSRTSATTCRRWLPVRSFSMPTAAE